MRRPPTNCRRSVQYQALNARLAQLRPMRTKVSASAGFKVEAQLGRRTGARELEGHKGDLEKGLESVAPKPEKPGK